MESGLIPEVETAVESTFIIDDELAPMSPWTSWSRVFDSRFAWTQQRPSGYRRWRARARAVRGVPLSALEWIQEEVVYPWRGILPISLSLWAWKLVCLLGSFIEGMFLPVGHLDFFFGGPARGAGILALDVGIVVVHNDMWEERLHA